MTCEAAVIKYIAGSVVWVFGGNSPALHLIMTGATGWLESQGAQS